MTFKSYTSEAPICLSDEFHSPSFTHLGPPDEELPPLIRAEFLPTLHVDDLGLGVDADLAARAGHRVVDRGDDARRSEFGHAPTSKRI